ncbi:MAG: hypothetical protein ACHQ0I_03635 [Candidatus Lutacidiplasmatales archaeon]|nr:hypothetical protein [Thermoplasmata archaeon]
MAKKVRRKLEEEEAAAFEFPVFDEVAFMNKEFELTYALTLAGLFTVLLGALAWGMTVAGLPWFVVFPLGIALLALSPFLIRRLRTRSSIYTKGDWAGLIALEFFGWLAMWFVLLNLSPHAL